MTEDLKNHLAALAELRNLAIKKGQYGAAVSAEVARGKAVGLYATAIQINTAATQPPVITSDDPSEVMAAYIAFIQGA